MNTEHDLVLSNIAFARKIAHRFHRSHRNLGFDYEDFEAQALLGLCEAAKRFQSERGLSFRTFCYLRVKGSMYDLLRRGGYLPRGAFRSESPNLFVARSLADCLAITETFEELGIKLYINREEGTADLTYARENDPESIAAEHSLRRHLERLLGRLSDSERRVIELRYQDGWTFEEIRASLASSSKSWICRLHQRALLRLKEMLEENLPEAA